MNKRGLGRGLDALLSSMPGTDEATSDIPVDQIDVNPNQPRKLFDSKALNELAASIQTSGVIQPIVVRRHGDSYQLIAGERRWRAARQAGLTRIPAVVRDATDAQSLEIALVENLLREDLNPMEEAEAYQKLLAQFGWTQEELARRVGLDRSSVANAPRQRAHRHDRDRLRQRRGARAARRIAGRARLVSSSRCPLASSSACPEVWIRRSRRRSSSSAASR